MLELLTELEIFFGFIFQNWNVEMYESHTLQWGNSYMFSFFMKNQPHMRSVKSKENCIDLTSKRQEGQITIGGAY